VLRAVSGGVTRRKVQTVVIGPLADSNAPFERAFAAQYGSDVTATSKASPTQLAATTRLASRLCIKSRALVPSSGPQRCRAGQGSMSPLRCRSGPRPAPRTAHTRRGR
jgi:hypothetical protein